MVAIFHGASAAERRIILQPMIAGTACAKMRVSRCELQQDVTAGQKLSRLRCRDHPAPVRLGVLPAPGGGTRAEVQDCSGCSLRRGRASRRSPTSRCSHCTAETFRALPARDACTATKDLSGPAE